jgi:hypothetical protein
MPVYVEVEDVEGNVHQWVTDSETFEKLCAQLGEPDCFLVASHAA